MTQTRHTSGKRCAAGKHLVARLGAVFALALGIYGMPVAHAALENGSTLSIGAGSQFEMEIAPGFFAPTAITGHDGLVLGTSQAASGSHSGNPDGSESPGIDNPWLFFSNTGMHFTNSPTNVVGGSGNTYYVDFSGWNVTWNGVAAINMGGAAWGTNPNGQAVVTCAVDCANGDTYTLYYTATVPNDGTTNFGNVHYRLTLAGTITAPPPGPGPTVTLSANPTSIASDRRDNERMTKLTWSSDNADSCTASSTLHTWIDPIGTSGTDVPVGPLNATETFTVTCTGAGVNANASVQVTVGPLPTVTLSAAATSVDYNGSTMLTWESANADSCSASGAWSGTKPTSGDETLTSLTADSTFILSCTGAGGQGSDTATVIVTGTPTQEPERQTCITQQSSGLGNGATLTIGTGSQFEMELATNTFVATPITGKNGLVLGTTQAASGSHSGSPNGSETAGIDQPWSFFGNTGLDFTSSPANVLSGSSNTYYVDFSGWRVTWNSIPAINMGSGAWGDNPPGQAIVTCGIDCASGDTYTLYYTATVPVGDPSGFGNVHYRLTLKGTINASAATIQTSSGTVGPGTVASSANDSRICMSKAVLDGTGLVSHDAGVHEQCVGGCFDFTVTGVTEPSVKVVLPLTVPVPDPTNAGYRKYNASTQAWRNFDATEGNSVMSASLAAGATECPAPGDAAYRTLTEGDLCLQLSIADGGPNDADGMVNGTVVDPGGMAVINAPTSTNVLSRASGSGGCSIARTPASPLDAGDWWLLAGFLIWLGELVRRRHRAARIVSLEDSAQA